MLSQKNKAGVSPESDETITPRKPLSTETSPDEANVGGVNDISSEFGVDEIDIEILEAARVNDQIYSAKLCTEHAQQRDASFVPQRGVIPQRGVEPPSPQEVHTIPAKSRASVRGSNRDTLAMARQNLDTAERGVAGRASKTDTDEFEDDANDVSVEDLEDACALYDTSTKKAEKMNALTTHGDDRKSSQQQSTLYGSSPEYPQIMSDARTVPLNDGVDGLSEDEFGGDIEFEHMVAACEKAAQSDSSNMKLPSSVCIRQFGTDR